MTLKPGFAKSELVMSVPLELCIAAPFGDEDTVRAEFYRVRSTHEKKNSRTKVLHKRNVKYCTK